MNRLLKESAVNNPTDKTISAAALTQGTSQKIQNWRQRYQIIRKSQQLIDRRVKRNIRRCLSEIQSILANLNSLDLPKNKSSQERLKQIELELMSCFQRIESSLQSLEQKATDFTKGQMPLLTLQFYIFAGPHKVYTTENRYAMGLKASH